MAIVSNTTCKYRRVVIKVGTSTLTHENGKLNLRRIERLAFVISDIKNRGAQIALVSSGAVAAGAAKAGLDHRPMTLREKQAMAAVGQTELMRMYEKFFSCYGYQVGQILLTKSVMDEQEPRENAKQTFETLFDLDIIPIVNENDSISYQGLKFGGNDTLAAYVALLCGAELLINLSDVDCLYDKDPHRFEDAEPIRRVADITPEIFAMAGAAGTERGTGGMKTKIQSAKDVTEAGINMIIAGGERPDILYDIFEGKPAGTMFIAHRAMNN